MGFLPRFFGAGFSAAISDCPDAADATGAERAGEFALGFLPRFLGAGFSAVAVSDSSEAAAEAAGVTAETGAVSIFSVKFPFVADFSTDFPEFSFTGTVCAGNTSTASGAEEVSDCKAGSAFALGFLPRFLGAGFSAAAADCSETSSEAAGVTAETGAEIISETGTEAVSETGSAVLRAAETFSFPDLTFSADFLPLVFFSFVCFSSALSEIFLAFIGKEYTLSLTDISLLSSIRLSTEPIRPFRSLTSPDSSG